MKKEMPLGVGKSYMFLVFKNSYTHPDFSAFSKE